MTAVKIRNRELFDEGLANVLNIEEILINPIFSSIIDYTDDYYELICNLIEYAENENNDIQEEVMKKLKDSKELITNIHRGRRGDFDDIGDME